METFNNSPLGRLLRWLAFIPIGAFFVFICDAILLTFLNWMFDNDLKQFVIVGLFLGGLVTILPVTWLVYWAIGKSVAFISPNRRIGAILFTVFTLFTLVSGIYEWHLTNLPNFWTASIMQTLTSGFVISGLVSAQSN